jgi:hypothetical protein
MYGELRAIEQRVGHEGFPLIPMNYYSAPNQMVIPPAAFPAIVKVSHAHAGMGKIRVHSNENFSDIATVLALHQDYCTAEPVPTTPPPPPQQQHSSSFAPASALPSCCVWGADSASVCCAV